MIFAIILCHVYLLIRLSLIADIGAMNKFFQACKQAFWDFFDDDCMSSGAAIAYYTMFSLPPLLVMVFLIAGMTGVSQGQIEQIVSQQLGLPTAAVQGGSAQQNADQRQPTAAEGASLQELANRTSPSQVGQLGWGSQLVGVLILVFSATGVFAQLQYALNRAWEVEPDPEQGAAKSFLLKRILSLGMIVVIAFLLLVSLVLTTLTEEIIHYFQGQAPSAAVTVFGVLLNSLVTFALATLLFAAMYKILPDADMSWKDVWVGAAMTALLFVIGKALIGWYLQYSQIGSSWGSAAASMVAMLVWVYYSSLIVLLGAELAQVWAKRYGHGIVPSKGAVRKIEEKRYVRGGEAQWRNRGTAG